MSQTILQTLPLGVTNIYGGKQHQETNITIPISSKLAIGAKPPHSPPSTRYLRPPEEAASQIHCNIFNTDNLDWAPFTSISLEGGNPSDFKPHRTDDYTLFPFFHSNNKVIATASTNRLSGPEPECEMYSSELQICREIASMMFKHQLEEHNKLGEERKNWRYAKVRISLFSVLRPCSDIFTTRPASFAISPIRLVSCVWSVRQCRRFEEGKLPEGFKARIYTMFVDVPSQWVIGDLIHDQVKEEINKAKEKEAKRVVSVGARSENVGAVNANAN